MILRIDDLSSVDEIRFVDQNGETRTFNLQEELRIDSQSLYREYLEQPAKYVYWSSILEVLRNYHEASELELEEFETQERNRAEDYFVQKGIKSNVQKVKDFPATQPGWKQLKANVQYYNHAVRKLQGIVKSFEQRKDMIVQIGAQQRKDFNNGVGSANNYA